MKAAIIYNSATGTTKTAAWRIGDALQRRGVANRIFDVKAIDATAVADADLVLVGSWTDGAFVAAQRPNKGRKFKRNLPDLDGKRAAVFTTYAINPGHTLDKLQKLVEAHGADCVGGVAIHRSQVDEGAEAFVAGVLDAVRV